MDPRKAFLLLAAFAAVAAVVVTVAASATGVGIESAGAAVAPDGLSSTDGVRTLRTSKAAYLDPNGEPVQLSGSGYDTSKGIYITFCVMPPAGQTPTPCGGGPSDGGGESSHWISSNPPPYGVGLATPYGPGGSFSVSISPKALLSTTVDCRVTACALVSRNDHTRSSDRGQDVLIPVTFGAAPIVTTTTKATPVPTTKPPTGGSTTTRATTPVWSIPATTTTKPGTPAPSTATLPGGASAPLPGATTTTTTARGVDGLPVDGTVAPSTDDGQNAAGVTGTAPPGSALAAGPPRDVDAATTEEAAERLDPAAASTTSSGPALLLAGLLVLAGFGAAAVFGRRLLVKRNARVAT